MPEALGVALALAAGASLQAAVGFGAGLLAAPLLALLLGPVEVVWLLLVSALVLGPLILVEPAARGRVEWRDAWWLTAFAVPSMPLGALVVHALGAEAMQVMVGCVVLAFLAAPPVGAGSEGRAVAGAAAGLMTTATSLNGPPLALWMRRRYEDPAVFRATITAVFVVLDALGLLVLLVAGPPTLSTGVVLAALAGTGLGWAGGTGLFTRLGPEQHRRVVTAVLALTALTSLAAGLV